MSSSTYLCVKDRKVWKTGYFGTFNCPVCGNGGKYMGTRWRAPKLTDKSAWAKIDKGDYLWDHKAIDSKNAGTRIRIAEVRARMRKAKRARLAG